jgi:nucleotide-binding universal stress UspA family protein
MLEAPEGGDMTTRQIVVGVDGSGSSRDALRLALAEARLRGAFVDAVHVWRYPPLAYAGILSAPVVAHEEFESGARALLDEEINAVLAEDHNPLRIRGVVLEGAAGEQLVRYAAHADLLLVGHRGRGRIADRLLGSVAQHCVTHATCPVIVVADAGRLEAA